MSRDTVKLLFLFLGIAIIGCADSKDSKCYCRFALQGYEFEGNYETIVEKSITSCKSSQYRKCKKECIQMGQHIIEGDGWFKKISDDVTLGDLFCKKEKQNIDGIYGYVTHRVCEGKKWFKTGERTNKKLYCKNGKMLIID